MTRLKTESKSLLSALWRADRPLTATGLLMVGVLVVALVGLVADPRTITGAPAWLKPAKFAVSIAIYTLTLAWVFTFLPGWIRTRLVVGWATAGTFVLEEVLIVTQAWRGTTSHFNVGTAFDAAVWSTMGIAIVVQTLASLAIVIALWRQRFADRALGWALRLGLTLSLVGASVAGLMTQPTAGQLAEARVTKRLPVVGAHTVGGADGGPGVPLTKWSVEHGDLRVPHFIGLHAMQVLPIVGLWLRQRRRSEELRVRLTFAAAASYGALFAIVTWQALRGQSIAAPDATMLSALAAWAVGTAAIAWAATIRRPQIQAHAVI